MKSQTSGDEGELREEVLKEAQKISKEMDEGKWVSNEEIKFYFRQKKILEDDKFSKLEDTG